MASPKKRDLSPGLSPAESIERKRADAKVMSLIEEMVDEGIRAHVVVDRMLTHATAYACLLSGQERAAEFLHNAAKACSNGMFAGFTGEKRKQ